MRYISHLKYNQLGYESFLFKRHLPIKYNKEDENDTIEKVCDFLDTIKCNSAEKKEIIVEDTKYLKYIKVKYIYEGHSGYYDFDLVFYIVYLTDKDELVLCGNIEQCVHELFEEIIIDKILPEWLSNPI